VSLSVPVLALVVAIPGLWGASGAPMEEGFMLVFGDLVAKGEVPHVDFLHLYGPGSLWVLAGVYRIAGATIAVERAVGAAQIVVLVLSIWALARTRGPFMAAAASLTATVIVVPLGLVALAWIGAVAAALAGFVALTAADRWSQQPHRGRRLVAAGDALGGALAAAALLYRPDLVVAIVVAVVVWSVQIPAHRRRWLLGAAAAVSSLWLVHLARSGPLEAFRGMVLEPVFELRPGRSLPVPPSLGQVDAFLQRAALLDRSQWPGIGIPESVQIHLWFWLVPVSILVALAGGWTLRRRLPESLAGRALWPVALFAAFLLPQALQRPDVTHLSWVSVVTFPVALVLGVELIARFRPAWSRRRCRAMACSVSLFVLLVAIGSFPLRGYVEAVGHTFRGTSSGYPVTRGERSFPYGSAADAAAAQEVIDALDARLQPGERLVVGPSSLSRTVYSDAWIYSLFDELTPGTRYIEMDPGLADAPGSGLATDVSMADWVVLSRVWQDWNEPNDSQLDGDPEAQQVLDDQFCEVLDNGRFVLYRRCGGPTVRPGP
jgi:hypothetical protein